MSRQYVQRGLLIVVELARFLVNDAEGSQRMTIGRDERHAGIETDFRTGDDEGVVLETLVLGRIRHDEEVLLQNRVRAHGDVTAGFAEAEADLGLEPLAVFVHQGDQRDGRAADKGREFGGLVKNRFGQRVQHVVLPEDFDALDFVLRRRRFHWQGAL